MRSKKILGFLLVSILLFSVCVLPASALDAKFSAVADYKSLKVSDTFNVRVAVNNIQTDEGIILVQFKLHFDSTCLKLIEWKTNKPEKWGDGFEEIAAPKTDENNPDYMYLYVSYMYSEKEAGKGISEDGILYTDITFEVLSDAANGTVIRIHDTDIMDDSNKYTSCNELEMKINFDGAKVTTIDTEDDSDKSGFNINNALKIAIGVAAVLIVVAGAYYIGKYIKKKT